MNISLVTFGALLIALFLAGLLRRQLLFTAWVLSFLVFPTARAKIGEAPIYLYDLVAVSLILSLLPRAELSAWPRRIPRWHLWFISSAFLLSVIFGVVQHGMAAEITWIWLHSSLAWMAFAFGVVIATAEERESYRQAGALGVWVSSIILCVIAIIQYAELPGTAFLSNLFYGDLGSEESVEILRHGLETNRAPGPHFAPTGFAGMALLSVGAFWLLTDNNARWRRTIVFTLSGLTILCTVSRHAMLAAAVGLIVALALSQGKQKLRLISAVGLACVLAATPAVGYLIKESWSHRISKWNEGVLEDENTAARVLWGPARLIQFISNEPVVLLTGAGLDPEKLASKSKHETEFDDGFVSNGFLLMLYYLGIVGFVLHGAFWMWACYVARRFPSHSRGPVCAFVATAVVIVAADNYSVMYEPAIALLFLIVGLIAGRWHVDREDQVEVEFTQDAKENVTEEAYAA